jgi:PI-3-kinase-related kinase SMG-1
LFARLSSHPEQVVRKQLEGLLMMLAKLSPWSIVYPTLVDVNTNEEPSEELQHILGCLVMEILSFNLLDSVAFVFFFLPCI